MKVATILPTRLLEHLDPKDDYHMCLFQEMQREADYFDFYKSQIEQGKFVIMDNGAAEGVNPGHEELAEVIEMVQPSEIVLPDIVNNKLETVKRSRAAYAYFMSKGYHETMNFMAVPQGETFAEWLACMKIFMRQEFVTTIGVSKFVTPQYQSIMGGGTNVRLECVDAILTQAEKLNRSIDIHLLGCWSDPTEIGEIAKNFGDKVRGTDSAIAYVYTRNGKNYKPGLRRPDNAEIEFDRETIVDDDMITLLHKNMRRYIEVCEGR